LPLFNCGERAGLQSARDHCKLKDLQHLFSEQEMILGELDYQRIVGYSQNRLAVAGARSGAVINEDAR
jgi:hypothetical protein